MADLTTTAKFKASYGISGSTKDTQIALLVTAASLWIERVCQRTFNSTAYTELFSPGYGDIRVDVGLTTLRPKQYPITAVTSLYDDSSLAFAGSTGLIAATDYYIGRDSKTVKLISSGSTVGFYSGENTVELKYTAGYSTIPQDIETAANMLTFHLYRMPDKQKQGITSETLGDLTVSYDQDAMPKEVMAILKANWIRPYGI